MIEEALYSRLSGFAGLTALVGTRIYPGILPQKPTYPAVTYTQVSAPRVPAMGSDTGLVRARFQVSAWSTDYQQARDVSEQVRLALERYRATVSGTEIQDIYLENAVDLFEPEAAARGVHHRAMDFTVWYKE